jgi:hypothetical protein
MTVTLGQESLFLTDLWRMRLNAMKYKFSDPDGVCFFQSSKQGALSLSPGVLNSLGSVVFAS